MAGVLRARCTIVALEDLVLVEMCAMLRVTLQRVMTSATSSTPRSPFAASRDILVVPGGEFSSEVARTGSMDTGMDVLVLRIMMVGSLELTTGSAFRTGYSSAVRRTGTGCMSMVVESTATRALLRAGNP
jgi:hypothetical protein